MLHYDTFSDFKNYFQYLNILELYDMSQKINLYPSKLRPLLERSSSIHTSTHPEIRRSIPSFKLTVLCVL